MGDGAGLAPCRLDPLDAGQRGPDDVRVELDAAVGVDRGLDDRRDRLREHRHVGPEEAFVLVQRAVREGDDRLERQRVELTQAEEVVEHLGLDDLGRLGHPDPVGQPGQLDRRRHRDEIAVALGQGVVDGHQSVLGCPGAPVRLGDLGDGRVGQCLGRRDEDDAGVELEEARR